MTLRGRMIEARWAHVVRDTLPDGEVLYSIGTDDYQGHVAIVAKLDDGRWLHYGWSYGSCSGCDAWEEDWNRYNATDAEQFEGQESVRAEIRNGAAIMDKDHFADYLVSCRAAGASWLRSKEDEESYSYETQIGLSVEELVARVLQA